MDYFFKKITIIYIFFRANHNNIHWSCTIVFLVGKQPRDMLFIGHACFNFFNYALNYILLCLFNMCNIHSCRSLPKE